MNQWPLTYLSPGNFLCILWITGTRNMACSFAVGNVIFLLIGSSGLHGSLIFSELEYCKIHTTNMIQNKFLCTEFEIYSKHCTGSCRIQRWITNWNRNSGKGRRGKQRGPVPAIPGLTSPPGDSDAKVWEPLV